jgi:hypothetical protein
MAQNAPGVVGLGTPISRLEAAATGGFIFWKDPGFVTRMEPIKADATDRSYHHLGFFL